MKTEFGFHYTEILSQKGSGTGYKIAYLPKEIVASQETDNLALNKANEFAGDSKDLKSFNETYDKKLKAQGINKSTATDITPVSYEVRGVGASRSFVRAIYEADMGEVLKPVAWVGIGVGLIGVMTLSLAGRGFKPKDLLAATIQPAEAATITMGNHFAGLGVCVRVMVLMRPWPAI